MRAASRQVPAQLTAFQPQSGPHVPSTLLGESGRWKVSAAMRLSKPCWTLSKGASPPPPPLQEAESTAECEGQDSRAPEKGSWSLYGNPHTKRCALSNRPFGSCAKARVCQEGHVCGRPHSHLLSRPASHPPCTSSSRIRNSSSSFWSFPSWTSCFNRASSVSICLIYKIEDGRDTGGHVRSTPWLSRQLPAVSGDREQPECLARALTPTWVCVGPPSEPG